jgi:hypothetical protein
VVEKKHRGGAESKKYRITSKKFIISGCAPAPPQCSAAPPLKILAFVFMLAFLF